MNWYLKIKKLRYLYPFNIKDFLEHYFFKTKQINSGEINIKLIGNEFETYDQDFNNQYSPKEKKAIMEELLK